MYVCMYVAYDPLIINQFTVCKLLLVAIVTFVTVLCLGSATFGLDSKFAILVNGECI